MVAVLEGGKEVTVGDGVDHPAARPIVIHMNEADALDIVQFAIWTVLTAAGPAVAVAMVVGVAIALVQALTQIQEITLTFVPKIVAILLVVAFSGPFIGGQISAFSNVDLRAHRERLLVQRRPRIRVTLDSEPSQSRIRIHTGKPLKSSVVSEWTCSRCMLKPPS